MSAAAAVTEANASAKVDTAGRFLVELEKTLTICRLYGTEHPAFRKGAESASASLTCNIQVSIHPKGFCVDRATVGAASDGTGGNDCTDLHGLAQRLRRMGLVGLSADAGLTADDVVALVLALHDADRTRPGGDAVARSIAAATGQRARATPLRLGDLSLIPGTAAPATGDGGGGGGDREDASGLWRELFATACFGPAGPAGPSDAGSTEAARSFEAAVRGVQSPAHWDAMVGVWLKELSAIDAPTARDRAPAAAGSPPPPDARLDAVASFLNALNPDLSQRLLGETIGSHAAPAAVVTALSDRLPTGVVLGALSAVDRTGGAPSSAALALLRSVAGHVNDERDGNGAGAGGPPHYASPRTNAELAEIGASLERLLNSNHEQKFVPEEYLRRRDELSRTAVGVTYQGLAVMCPTEAETRRHAASVVLQMLASPDANPGHLAAGLGFLRTRMCEWIRAGEYDVIAGAADVGYILAADSDASVAAAARALLDDGLGVDALIDGSGGAPDRAAAVAEIRKLLLRDDGAILVHALRSPRLAAPELTNNPVVEAVRKALPDAPAACFRKLFEPAVPLPRTDATSNASEAEATTRPGNDIPAGVIPTLAVMPEANAIRAAEAMLPHATTHARYAIIGALFRRNIRWPLPLTERLLTDEMPGIRRLAVMRVVRDNDPATAAGYLAAASRAGAYAADVAVGLAELLYKDRRHPDVRAAYRQWFWSWRRWASLVSVRVATGKGAA